MNSDTLTTALELDFFAPALGIPEYRQEELGVRLTENSDVEMICYDDEYECADC